MSARASSGGSGFSPFALRAFELVFRPWMRRHIRAVRVTGTRSLICDRTPVMLVANHPSWWDAFLLREANRALRPGAPILTVMLQRELEQHPFLRRLGAVGMDPASPGSVRRVIRILQVEARRVPETTILFFPQGRIWPSYRRPLGFRPGVALFIRQLAPIHVVPVGLHIEPLAAPAATAFVAMGEPLREAEVSNAAPTLERAVEEQLDRILALLAREGEHADRGWPEPADRLAAIAPEPGT